jgi:outer membrane protein TolC
MRKWVSLVLVLCVSLTFGAGRASSQVLTADGAVKVALEKSSQAVQAEANVLDARSGLYGANSRMLPHLSASLARSGTWIDHSLGSEVLGGQVTLPRNIYDNQSYQTAPTLSGLWNVLNLSAIQGRRSASSGLDAARFLRSSDRNDLALEVRRQFYAVVSAIQTVRVNVEALRLARDNERRVRALFEVGSVSKSDVLRAQVQTAQGELDSLTSNHNVFVQRIGLANLMGIPETELGAVDTVLAVNIQDYQLSEILAEAEQARPDIKAAEAGVRAAKSEISSARFRRLPYVTVDGSATFNGRQNSSFELPPLVLQPDSSLVEDPSRRLSQSSRRESDRVLSARVALNWDFFDGMATDAANASARARLLRAEENRDALRRNLQGEVQRVLQAYRESVEADKVATRALESAAETVNLTQQKYNVGSATILDLIDAQVQLQRARSQRVAALTTIRIAEAAIDRVRGRGE